ncbi:MAG TPA: DNA gyrase subunit A [Candidatus Tectomicrobia bacterium]|nr:DNA gyrase subunit A [Candidatus Tectomicrobia bacterium]
MATDARPTQINIEDEMRTAFLDYAMSVIIARALPDVRDGLKPVHRRALLTLYDLNLTPDRGYRKCAKICGDISGNYHPHGEGVVYPSIVRLAQRFAMRYPLVDGQGNYGSVDGDPPAAMRYTEARMTEICQEMLRDLEKETVDFVPNYDGTREEPVVLPSTIPNLLMNGSAGIAVGMATNIPPHNLSELINGLVAMLADPQISVEELMQLIPGPDFPTAGLIYGTEGIREAYHSGRGLITMRARALIEHSKRTSREQIIITEIPYQVNKAKLVEKIAELVRDRKIEGISDLRDESDREGMRVVIELARGAQAEVVLNQLYKQTPMQSTFGVIMLALVGNQPRIMPLAELMSQFLEHRKDVVTRRTRFDLRKARERAHILEGLRVALEHLDRVIQLIRAAESPAVARDQLIATLSLTEEQAQAILDMRLQRLTALERDKILQEHAELQQKIVELEGILADEVKVRAIIKEELLAIKDKYGDERRTEIVEEAVELNIEDLIPQEDVVVTVSHGGYIKRTPARVYRSQHRGGKGIKAMETKEEDFVGHFYIANTHHYILWFTNTGKVHWLKVYAIPEGTRASRGKALVNLLQLEEGETISAMVPVEDFTSARYVIMTTKRGLIKKTPLAAFGNPRTGGIRAISLDDGDELIAVKLTDGSQHIFLGTADGKAIQFREEDVRPMGRTARGVIGIDLEEGDALVAMEVVNPGATMLTVCEHGHGKRTALDEYRVQMRGGKGLINIKVTERNGRVVGIKQVTEADELMIMTTAGNLIRLPVRELAVISRNTQGVRLISLHDDDAVASVATIEEEPEVADML